jgi:hypothetical protein
MSLRYGDSTAFPHDADYLNLIEAGVDCAVDLASAQHVMDAVRRRSESDHDQVCAESRAHAALLDRLQQACQCDQASPSERVQRTAARALALVSEMVAEAEADGLRQLEEAALRARARIGQARQASQRAVEHFLARYAPPRSAFALRLSASPGGTEALLAIGTPFQLQAVFDLDVPASHPWSRLRRVEDLASKVDVPLPRACGWLVRRVKMTVVRLDRHFVSDVRIRDGGGSLRLQKHPSSGGGYEVRLPVGDGGAWVCPFDEQAMLDPQRAITLNASDAAALLRLWESTIESCADLYPRRGAMTSARFGNQPLDSLESPSELAQVLVQDMAPLTSEIARRSGAPGELVLRRDAGPGRRWESYLTHTELLERIFTLPVERRGIFAPLGLLSAELGSIPPPREAGGELAVPESCQLPRSRQATHPGVAAGPPLAATSTAREA